MSILGTEAPCLAISGPQLDAYIQKAAGLPYEEQREILALLERLEEVTTREKVAKNFLPFVKSVWPAFIEGSHHKIMADAFERVANGKLKRLIVNIPPRHTKSEFASLSLIHI